MSQEEQSHPKIRELFSTIPDNKRHPDRDEDHRLEAMSVKELYKYVKGLPGINLEDMRDVWALCFEWLNEPKYRAEVGKVIEECSLPARGGIQKII